MANSSYQNKAKMNRLNILKPTLTPIFLWLVIITIFKCGMKLYSAFQRWQRFCLWQLNLTILWTTVTLFPLNFCAPHWLFMEAPVCLVWDLVLSVLDHLICSLSTMQALVCWCFLPSFCSVLTLRFLLQEVIDDLIREEKYDHFWCYCCSSSLYSILFACSSFHY